MKKIFIGGSRKISKINNEIKKRIDNVITQYFTVLVGDANGVDKSIQAYLSKINYRNVYIYSSGEECRNNIGQWEVKYIKSNLHKMDYKFYSLKDIEMSNDADYGFMIWDGKSRGTLSNVMNLLRNNKVCLLYLAPEKTFYNIKSYNDLQSIVNQQHKLNIEIPIQLLFDS
jgi:hypothetical protein